MQASELYEKVTNQIIADLEKGVAPWVKPWKGGNSGGIMQINAATHHHYTGNNVLMLWSARDEHGYPSPQWMTFKQAIDKGAYVRKGEKGTPVIFAKKLTFNEGDEDERQIFMHRSFTVFNVAQIEEFPKKTWPKQSSPRTRRVPLSRRPWQYSCGWRHGRIHP